MLPLFFTRPAVTPQSLRAVERGLRVLSDAGFALSRALDMINALSIFVVGHAMAEVGTAELSRRGGPGSAAALAQLDASDLPLVTEAARLSEGVDDEARFQFAVDALLRGFAQWLEPDEEPRTPRRRRRKSD